MNAISPFVQRMTELLTEIQSARTAEDRQRAKDAMAELIKAQSRGERVRPPRRDFDPKLAQTGERE